MEPTSARRDVVLLGSTGSIGTQAADIIRRNPGRFRVAGLAAGGGNLALLAGQALEFGAEVVAVADETRAGDLRQAVQAEAARSRPGAGAAAGLASGAGTAEQCAAGRAWPLPKILAGPDAVAEVAAWS
jgi:1-deoxy-D-xylulose-5-phosphate reductoisomerase